MDLDLEAASAGRFLAIYDASAAAPELAIAADEKEPSATALAAARDGRMLLIHIPEDCEARIRVFVDEEPPAGLRAAAHASRVDGALLAVRSGQLVASGADAVGSADADEPGLRSRVPVPSGSYRLSAFHTFHWKARHRRELLAARTTLHDRRLLRIGNALGILAVIFLFGNFVGLPWTGALWLKRGSWQPLAVLLGIDALLYPLVWLGGRFLDASPRYRAAIAARDGIDVELPDVVVVLTSGASPDGAAPALLEVPL
jgi:hypothetical protein